ncbi:MAG: transcription termination factor NusA, partial [Clostridia bacterium]|nr:transcription termination factor NusA [Clostridia bacterium]
VIVQGIREAEKSNIIREYEKKREEVISAVVTKRDEGNGDVEVDTGTSTAWLRKDDQLPGEELHVGDRIRVFVTEVKRDTEAAGPLVTLSRTHPNMLRRMFEADIPEIQDGTVLLKGVAREAGSRSKIAVLSRDPEVDAVGACIGNRGMRIGSIVDELRGEKIDVIAYSDSMEEYIAAALSPASVLEVEFDGERTAKAIVSGDQLSLAIGKEGQNVRLAAKLTGCKIDIKGVKQN